MEYKQTVTFEGNYVRAYSEGEKSFKSAQQLFTEIMKLCNEHNCYRILGVGNSKRPIKTLEAYQAPALFQGLDVNHEYRIAWVELNPESKSTALFVENVLYNRGFHSKVFDDVETAKTWLLEED